MADPTFQMLCCRNANFSENFSNTIDEFDTDIYNKCCIISSLIGILGSMYQIVPRYSSGYKTPINWSSMSPSRGNQIVTYLAIADLLASLGLLIRSIVWINRGKLNIYESEEEDIILCATTSAMVQYFYMSTWLWTICYAIDMKFVLFNRRGFPLLYHFFCWIVPAILCAIALLVLYLPNANCRQIIALPQIISRILPNYLVTYGPLVIALILCPTLYIYSWKQTRFVIIRGLNQVTSRERAVLKIFKIKFALITLALYFCWLPNLVTSIILWSFWHSLPSKLIVSLWYIMAVVNPLQAFLNAIVYRKWSTTNEINVQLPWQARRKSITESTPLLQTSSSRSSINSITQ